MVKGGFWAKGWRGASGALRAAMGAMFAAVLASTAWAQNADQMPALGRTRLLSLSLETMNSAIVRDAARLGVALSGGETVDLGQWYRPDRPNLTAIFATALGPDLSLIWGGSTGERGAKYTLGPAQVLGLSLQRNLGRSAQLNLEIYGSIGGALQESACTGDYGALGSGQAVNCRYAASYLPPAETLPLLWDMPARRQLAVKVTYQWRF